MISQEERAKRFLETTMLYPDDTFDAVLMWDILDYLDSDLMAKLATRITSLVRESGVVFAMFHTRKPILFHRYRVLDAQSLELIPATCPFQPQRVFQNREISNLFSRYRSSSIVRLVTISFVKAFSLSKPAAKCFPLYLSENRILTLD